MLSPPPPSSPGGLRVVICDYNALLQSVTGLLRMSGYRVFQAYDGQAAEELCSLLPDVGLLVLKYGWHRYGFPKLDPVGSSASPGLAGAAHRGGRGS
jgi:hypothetical protein